MLPPGMASIEGHSEQLDEEMPWDTMKRRIAFVPPRFGADIVGGAEAVVRDIALGMVERNWEVEVLTTCAVNPYTWANELPEGANTEGGLLVRRFQNVLATSASKEHWVHGQIYYGHVTTLDDQVTWLSALFRTPGLFETLLKEGPVSTPSSLLRTFSGALLCACQSWPSVLSSCPACTTSCTPTSTLCATCFLCLGPCGSCQDQSTTWLTASALSLLTTA